MTITTGRSVLLASTFLFLLSAAGPARAGGGTHFLIEPYSGVVFNHGFSLENEVGMESGALLALGGKIKGFPPRFYLYLKVSQSFFGADEIYVAERRANGVVRRSYTGIVGGLRMVFPLLRNLRLNLEAGGGRIFSRNKYTESGWSLPEYEESLAVMDLGAGLNLRLYRWLSLGIMYDYRFLAEGERGDLISTVIGDLHAGTALGWSTLAATLGIHF